MNEFNNEKSNNTIDEQIEKKEDKKNVFNIVIGVSTLLIAILGATFAYFSATATSKENDVNVKSAYVSISYDGGTEIKASNLIPSTERIALTMFQKQVDSIGAEGDEGLEFEDQDEYTNEPRRRCIDVKGREVCYVYQFSIESDGEEAGTTAINGYIKVNQNEFENLSYVLYEVEFQTNEQGKVLLDKFGHKLIKSYSLVSEFNNVDDNPDHELDDPNYATFENPEDIRGEDGEYTGTTYPLACLFGFSDTYESAEKDDPSRCKTINITNQEKHSYQLMIWLRETGERQDEQGLSFQGTVSLEVPGGVGDSDYENGQITGQQ